MPKIICPACGEPNNDINPYCLKCKTPLEKKLPPEENKNVSGFISISRAKVFFMSFFSIGIYDIFWFYAQWKELKKLKYYKCPVFIAAIFPMFSVFPLAYKIYAGKTHFCHISYFLAPAIILLSVIANLENSAALFILFLLQRFIMSYSVSCLQKIINTNHKDSVSEKELSLNAWTITFSVFLFLSIIGQTWAYKSLGALPIYTIPRAVTSYAAYKLMQKNDNLIYKTGLLYFGFISEYDRSFFRALTHAFLTIFSAFSKYKPSVQPEIDKNSDWKINHFTGGIILELPAELHETFEREAMSEISEDKDIKLRKTFQTDKKTFYFEIVYKELDNDLKIIMDWNKALSALANTYSIPESNISSEYKMYGNYIGKLHSFKIAGFNNKVLYIVNNNKSYGITITYAGVYWNNFAANKILESIKFKNR
ncbi:MAG: hypothetical protein LBR69_03765 [Endomicrobium sp.]|jgi:hypothetical protein|nr:hypothetical protein [Endomicrobium sp.]